MELPVTLRSSRKKMLLMLVGSLVFVAAGLLFPTQYRALNVSMVIFFGLCAVAFCVNLLPNSSYLPPHTRWIYHVQHVQMSFHRVATREHFWRYTYRNKEDGWVGSSTSSVEARQDY